MNETLYFEVNVEEKYYSELSNANLESDIGNDEYFGRFLGTNLFHEEDELDFDYN